MSEEKTANEERDRKAECELIINAASTASAAAGGLTLIPGSDAVVIMPIQIGMVIALGRVYGVRVSKTIAKSAIYAGFGQIVGQGGVRLLLGLVPGVGSAVRAGVAFSVTQAIGTFVVDQLVEGDFAY